MGSLGKRRVLTGYGPGSLVQIDSGWQVGSFGVKTARIPIGFTLYSKVPSHALDT